MTPTALMSGAASKVRDGIGGLSRQTADTRQLAINAIVNETGATPELATGFVDSIVSQVARGLPSGRNYWHPSDGWLQLYHDAIFVKVMPDEAEAKAGSAHQRLEALCGEKVGRPVSLTHTSDTSEGLYHCALQISFLPK